MKVLIATKNQGKIEGDKRALRSHYANRMLKHWHSV